MYDINPKPIKYKGRLFRSRLEARWAAFFDLLRWEWEYEPFDLYGWSPDFLIKPPLSVLTFNEKILVEVKPQHMVDTSLYAKMYEATKGTDYKLLLLPEYCVEKIKSENATLGFSGLMPLDDNICTFTYNGIKYNEFSVSYICQRECGNISIIQYCNKEWDDKHWQILSDYHLEKFWNDAANIVMFLKPNLY